MKEKKYEEYPNQKQSVKLIKCWAETETKSKH